MEIHTTVEKQNKTKQNKTKQNKTNQNKTKQNKTKQNKTKQNKTKKQQKKQQNRTEEKSNSNSWSVKRQYIIYITCLPTMLTQFASLTPRQFQVDPVE